VDHFASSFDVGQVINPKQIRGSVMGGVMMAIGATLYEQAEFDDQGRLVNPQFSSITCPPIRKRRA